MAEKKNEEAPKVNLVDEATKVYLAKKQAVLAAKKIFTAAKDAAMVPYKAAKDAAKEAEGEVLKAMIAQQEADATANAAKKAA